MEPEIEKGPPRKPPRREQPPFQPGGLEEDGGGQRTEVDHPYDAEGGARRGVEKQLQSDEDPLSEPPD